MQIQDIQSKIYDLIREKNCNPRFLYFSEFHNFLNPFIVFLTFFFVDSITKILSINLNNLSSFNPSI